MDVVYEAASLIDAHLVRIALEHGGIPAFVRGEALLGGVGELPACGLAAVCVPDSCWPEIRVPFERLPLAGDAVQAPVERRWPRASDMTLHARLIR
jgi:hypothetical protein